MKQEYIIGDWVMLNGRKAFVNDSYTDADETFVYIVNDEEYKESELKGIPLTPEILEKNGGWKKSKINDIVLLYYKDDVYLKYNTVTGFFFFSDFDYRSSEILLKYVHQFQHLLFGFGLNSDMEV